MPTLLRATDLTKQYDTGGDEPLTVLHELSMTVDAGEVVAVMGESGSGKSTLLHLLGALDRPTSGRITFDGADLGAMDDDARARFRNTSVGFVFQFHHLLPEFTALENVAMPSLIQHRSLDEAQERARTLLQTLGLADRAEHRPSALSGGEKQRVAVARALMNEPQLVLMDEPTGNLDARTAEPLHREIERLSRELGQTFVIVTHNPSLASIADRVLRLEYGHLQDVDDPWEAVAPEPREGGNDDHPSENAAAGEGVGSQEAVESPVESSANGGNSDGSDAEI